MRWRVLFLSAFFICLFPAGARPQARVSNPSRSATQARRGALPVHVLPTANAFSDTPQLDADQYPKTVRLDSGPFDGAIAAYGAAHIILIGPGGWTGAGFIAVDGNTSLDLYPADGSATSGPRLHYSEVPACLVCMLGEAAPYFPEAMKRYNTKFDSSQSAISIPKSLRVNRLSPTLVAYSLPNQDGLLVRGVAYYDGSQFIGIRFLLPQKESELEDFLQHTFIVRLDRQLSSAQK